MSSHQGGFAGGGGGDTTFAAMGRGPFVTDLISQFERAAMTVEQEVTGYVLGVVLADDAAWERALQAGEFDLGRVREVLLEALERAAQMSRQQGRASVSRDVAERAFYDVVHDKWHCPFPFLIC